MTHSLPSRLAVALSDAASEPAVGSVRQNDARPRPSDSCGKNSRFCSGVPSRAMELQTMPLFTATPTASDGHAAASSSSTSMKLTADAPRPPWASGTFTPRIPRSPSDRMTSGGMVPRSSAAAIRPRSPTTNAATPWARSRSSDPAKGHIRRSRSGFRLLHRFGERRQEFEDVADDPIVGDLEDVGVGILVHRDDHLARGHPSEMLDRTRDAERDVEVRCHRLAGLPDLLLIRAPAGV